MARTITPTIEAQTCPTHKVELQDGVCRRCEYVNRRNTISEAEFREQYEGGWDTGEGAEPKPTQRTRRCPVETDEESGGIPEATKRTRMPDDKEYLMKTRCHWPCPCGGTVPDAPASCAHRRFTSKAATHCVDAQLCTRCGQRASCDAFDNYTIMVRQRHQEDLKKSKKED